MLLRNLLLLKYKLNLPISVLAGPVNGELTIDWYTYYNKRVSFYIYIVTFYVRNIIFTINLLELLFQDPDLFCHIWFRCSLYNSVNLLLLQQGIVTSSRRSDHVPSKVFPRMISVWSSGLWLQAKHLSFAHNLPIFATKLKLLRWNDPLTVFFLKLNVELFGESKRLWQKQVSSKILW